jgi:hypothetical protein
MLEGAVPADERGTTSALPERDVETALDLARRVVLRVAPDELPQLEQIAHTLPPAPRRRRRGALDFGVSDTIAVISPAVMLVANAVLSRLGDAAGDAVLSKAGALGRWLAALLPFTRLKKSARPLVSAQRRSAGKTAKLSVQPARSRELRRLVRRCALRAGLSREQARALEQAFLAELVDGGGGAR